MIGRLRTVVFDAADMDVEAQFWSALLDIPVVQRSDDWTTLEGRDVRLAVQLAPDHVPPRWPDPSPPQQLHRDIDVDDVDLAERTSACTPTLPGTLLPGVQHLNDVRDAVRQERTTG